MVGKKKKGCEEIDYDSIEYLKRQLKKARNKGDFKEVASIHNLLGVAYRERKDYEEALEEHEEEARVTKKHFQNDKVAIAVAYRGKAEVYLEMDEQELALPLVRDYLKLSIEAGDLVEQQRAHITLGRVYIGLSLKYADNESTSTSAEVSSLKLKALERAEKEFRKARELLNHEKVRCQQSESNLMDMKCGAFINLAITLEMKGQTEESKQFFLKAIELGKKNSLHLHLYRCHLNLCEMSSKEENYIRARELAEEAGKAARALGNQSMEVDAKFLEAKMFYLLDEIPAGVKILKKLKKLESKSKRLNVDADSAVTDELWADVNSLLKCGIRIKRTEETLDLLESNNYGKRKQLYEILGDNYCKLGNYGCAILAYEKAVQSAELGKMPSSELAKLYFSLAETYNDKKDYCSALEFFKKEILLHRENPAEAFKTQTNIIAVMERSKMAADELIDAHDKAIHLSILCDCPRKELIALKNKASYYKSVKLEDEAGELLKRCAELKELYNISGEEEDSQDLLSENDDNDSIDLENLSSDESEPSDEEQPPQKLASTTKNRKIRLNEKGETPLHIAAQKGDARTVSRLLCEGHNINARDCAGWTPLHEACNFGAVEVVEALLEAGANVDDPGGEFCDLTTPLHDAAANGQTEVMSVLLKYRPNILAKNSQGHFILDELINWKTRLLAENPQLSADAEALQSYRQMKAELISRMAKAGYKYEKKDELRARRRRRQRSSSPKFALLHGRRGTIPVKTVIDDFDPDNVDAAVDLYSATMEGLRGTSAAAAAKSRKAKLASAANDNAHDSDSSGDDREALIPESQAIGDDWLENDIKESNKTKVKRKRDPMDEIRSMDRSTKRKKNGQRNDVAKLDILEDERMSDSSSSQGLDLETQERQPGSSSSSNTNRNRLGERIEEETENPNSSSRSPSRSPAWRAFEDSFDDDEPTVIENLANSSTGGGGESRIRQPASIVVDIDSDGDDDLERTTFPLSRRRVVQTRLPFKKVESASDRNADRTAADEATTTIERRLSQNQIPVSMCPKALRLKVRIGDKTLLVPVGPEYLACNIDWLSEECAKRYSESSGLKPVLSLSTKDGAFLSGSDIIHSVLRGTEIELIANVTSVDLPRLPERLRSLFAKIPDFNLENGILVALEICQSSNVLNLSDFSLHPPIGPTLFQALKYQYELKELILAECCLQDEGIKHLGSILPTLRCLTLLDLQCNGITAEGLQFLTESFRMKPDIEINRPSTGLTSLNLSFNPLGNAAGAFITDLLLQLPALKILQLADCDFNVRMLAECKICDAFKKIKLDELDISYNGWGSRGMEIILATLPTTDPVVNLICKSCSSNNEED